MIFTKGFAENKEMRCCKIMNQENKEIADILRREVKQLQSDRLIKLESERKLERRLMVGRQRIREVINQLVSEGLLIKYEGKGTYVTPIVIRII